MVQVPSCMHGRGAVPSQLGLRGLRGIAEVLAEEGKKVVDDVILLYLEAVPDYVVS